MTGIGPFFAWAVALSALPLSACAPAVQKRPALTGSTAASDACHAADARWALGKAASADVLARISPAHPDSAVRVIRPDDAITEDLRPDRTNIDLDASGTIVRIWCG